MPAAVARVLIDSPLPQLDRLLDYRIPEGMTGVGRGVRVGVPLRSAKRIATGYLIDIVESHEHPGPLSDLDSVISGVPVLRPEVWALARAVADRAAGSAADVLRIAIPPRQARVEKAWLSRGELPERPQLVAPPVDGYLPGVLDEVIRARGRIALDVDPGVLRVDEIWVGRWALALAQTAASTLAAGESALLIVPDHRDERQLLAALGSLVPERFIVRWDARQPNPDRARALLRAADEAVIVIGTRSAVYAPAERLGLIAVWNDGDPLLGEQLAPYVHARDAALIRQGLQNCALILAGHTRTTDVQRLVELGFLEVVAPSRPRRPRVIAAANVLSDDRLAAQARIPSIAWRHARDGLAEGPVLVQVARPGYRPGLRCAECGTDARCTRCGGPLRQTRSGAVPSCLWCAAPAADWSCAACGSTRWRPVGAGATRTAEELGRAFPGSRVVIADGERTVLEIDDSPALVIATRGAEPIATGGYRAVLLLDGDRMVARERLRIGEDCLRWWSDAAALAADGAPVVLVGVAGGLASALATWQQADYATAELADRRELRFPPAVRVATLEGVPDAVDSAVAALDSDMLVGLRDLDGRRRALIRFDYGEGTAVAAELRAEIIRQATARRPSRQGPPPPGRRPLPLRAHLDDPEPFEL